ncbi:hypothetical protein ACQVP2_34035 [Methylobacterium aquaticum]|uniref:hypothetical protein n=1 Tax=Methylobacterium aquaticum TaxID=270351 RepID=UPI003D187663
MPMTADNSGPEDGLVFRVGGEVTPDQQRRMVERPVDWHPAGDIRVFLVISRFETDHALTYLFCEGAPGAARVQNFVDQRRDRFRGNNVVIELAESYYSLPQAKQRALALRTWLGNVNVVYPPIRFA